MGSSIGILNHGRLVTAGPVDEVLRTAGASGGVTVRLAGTNGDGPELEAAAAVVRALSFVEAVESVAEDDELDLRLASSARESAPEVAAALITAGHRLRHLEVKRLELEEAYLRLTDGDNEPA